MASNPVLLRVNKILEKFDFYYIYMVKPLTPILPTTLDTVKAEIRHRVLWHQTWTYIVCLDTIRNLQQQNIMNYTLFTLCFRIDTYQIPQNLVSVQDMHSLLSSLSIQQQVVGWNCSYVRASIVNTVDFRYFEVQRTLWYASRYPYFDVPRPIRFAELRNK